MPASRWHRLCVAMAIGGEKLKDSGMVRAAGYGLPSAGTYPTSWAGLFSSLPAYGSGMDDEELAKDAIPLLKNQQWRRTPGPLFAGVSRETIGPQLRSPGLRSSDCSGSTLSGAVSCRRSPHATRTSDLVKGSVAAGATRIEAPRHDFGKPFPKLFVCSGPISKRRDRRPQQLAFAEVHDCFTPRNGRWRTWVRERGKRA